MTLLRSILAPLAVALLTLSPGLARAVDVLYGITSMPPQLITIDTTTGAGTLVANLVLPASPIGIAFQGGKLYSYDQGPIPQMVQINPATGATIAVIPMALPAWIGEGDLDFRSDGICFLMGFGPGPLRTVNLSVPSITPVAPLSPTMDGLAFDGAGVLYGLSEANGLGPPNDDPSRMLYTINTTTAVKTLVGPTGIAAPSSEGGLAFDSSGNLYAAVANGGPSTFYKVNQATGAATLIGNIGFGTIVGIRFQTGPSGGGGGGGGGAGGSGSSGGVGEGSFAGVLDPPNLSGSEGSFGFGGHLAALTALAAPPALPRLRGPFLNASGQFPSGYAAAPPPGTNLIVYNVGGQSTAQVSGQQSASAADTTPGFAVLAGLSVAVALGLAKSIPVLSGTSAGSM